jgi:TPP-dependent pyruvate/acetoin dehydrogenase alpha subunit
MTISNVINPDDPISLYKGMLLIRRLEEALIQRYPEQEMRCPVHFSIGQEAIAVGVSAFLNHDDWVVSNHRSHAHYVAKGGDLSSFVAELYGKSAGCCAGRGGSMHLTDMNVGFLAGIPIVGSAMAIAAGVAMSQQRNKSKSITTVYIGDAAAESGSFHETLNYASLNNLPLLTVCENNEFSIFTPMSMRQPPNRTISDLSRSHGIRTFEASGDNVLEVVEIMRQAKSYMVAESKPAFIEFNTYRLLEHCGPNFDDDLNYRDPLEVNRFANRDPLHIMTNFLISENRMTEEKMSEIDVQLKLEITNLIDSVKSLDNADYELSDKVFWVNS